MKLVKSITRVAVNDCSFESIHNPDQHLGKFLHNGGMGPGRLRKEFISHIKLNHFLRLPSNTIADGMIKISPRVRSKKFMEKSNNVSDVAMHFLNTGSTEIRKKIARDYYTYWYFQKK